MTVFALLMFSCQSTKLEEQNLLEQPASLKIDKEDNCFALYQYDENSYYDFSDKYIFFRLYQPYYDNPFCVENILNNFKPSVPANVYSRIIYTNTRPKLNLLKNYIKS